MGVLEDEVDWIRRSCAGDPSAFEPLVARYQRMVHALTYRMTGSTADAEDLAQETFLRAYRRLDTYCGDATFATWLGRIAIHLCLNWTSRAQRHDQLHRDWAAQLEIPAPRAANAEANLPGEIHEQIQQALLRLPAKQRAALILTVYEGLNHSQAARVLGCAETTVSWRLFAARNKLRRLLKPLD
jgi:RNA polymerase sigma-70 factor, ECF subfamily